MDETAVTAVELAAKLNCSVDKVYRLARGGKIPGIRISRSWRFFPDQVIAHLQKPKDVWEQPPGARAHRGKAAR